MADNTDSIVWETQPPRPRVSVDLTVTFCESAGPGPHFDRHDPRVLEQISIASKAIEKLRLMNPVAEGAACN